MGNCFRTTLSIFTCILIGNVLCLENDTLGQDISPSDQKQLKRIAKLVDDGGKLFKKKDYAASAKSISRAQKSLIKLAEANPPAFHQFLKKDYERIVKARKLLESKGEKFDAIKELSSYSNESSSDGPDPDSEEISFIHQVAPIVMEHCGSCHIDQTKGRYSAETYDALKKGSRKGPAVRPRDLKKSRLVTLIENGKMPPKAHNNPVPEEQLQILKDWISQGAKFDGSSRQKKAMLSSYVKQNEGSGSKSSGSGKKRDRSSIGSLGG